MSASGLSQALWTPVWFSPVVAHGSEQGFAVSLSQLLVDALLAGL
jgi:hypothetical protein